MEDVSYFLKQAQKCLALSETAPAALSEQLKQWATEFLQSAEGLGADLRDVRATIRDLPAPTTSPNSSQVHLSVAQGQRRMPLRWQWESRVDRLRNAFIAAKMAGLKGDLLVRAALFDANISNPTPEEVAKARMLGDVVLD
jgi:hypothetical protein